MLTVRRPNTAAVTRCLEERQNTPFTYEPLGISETLDISSEFDVDRQQTLLGFGEEVYQAAKDAIRRWEMFPEGLTKLYWPNQAIRVGEHVAVLFRAGPLWSLNPCRIVHVCDSARSADGIDRFGFAYGTLEGHLESGEERFSVRWNRNDDSVHYELLAVSRPNHFLTKVGYPYARVVQARFRRRSALAMKRAVARLRPRTNTAPPCDFTSL
ncbi:MAG: DUF1990 domain-containing protein [Planctomycetes bacterium]|nr:DUF1990 domain-containing protein [Planctomycetota bacterium]